MHPLAQRPAVAEGHFSVGSGVRDVVRALSSKSAATILLAGMLYALATGLVFSMAPYFYTYFFQLTPRETSVLLAGSFISAGIALPMVPLLSRWMDKRLASAWITALIVLTTPISLTLSLLGRFPASDAPPYAVFTVLGTVLPFDHDAHFPGRAVRCDAGRRDRGERGAHRPARGGVFFAASLFIKKSNTGLGVLFSGALVGLVGCPAHAESGAVPSAVLTTMGEVYVSAIVVLNIASVACVLFFRITRKAHAENLAILAARRTAAAVAG